MMESFDFPLTICWKEVCKVLGRNGLQGGKAATEAIRFIYSKTEDKHTEPDYNLPLPTYNCPEPEYHNHNPCPA